MKAFTEGPESDIAELIVQFTRGDEAVASITIRPLAGAPADDTERSFDYILLAVSYMANMLFNLGDDPAAGALLATVEEQGNAIGESPTLAGRFSTQPVEKGAVSSEWRATLRRRKDGLCVLDTFPAMSGDPRLLSKISILGLFDYLKGELPPLLFQVFLAGLGGMLSYYENRGTSHPQLRFGGPERAMEII